MLQASESYLYPRFDALENGATPNFADIHAYLRDGIELDFVEDFRRHVPCRLSPLAPPAPPAAPPPSALAAATSPSASLVKLMNRVPLLPLHSSPSPPPSPAPPSEEAESEVVSPERGTAPPRSARAAISPAETLPAPVKAHPFPLPPPVAGRMLPVPPQPALVRAIPLYNVFPPPQLFHPVAPFAPVPHVFASPLPPLQFPFPPRACQSPPPPYSGAPAPRPPEPRRFPAASGAVVLSASECEIYSLLNRVDRNAAHWYMVDTISRRRFDAPARVSTLNPDAAEFRSASVTTQTEPGPPPGFELP